MTKAEWLARTGPSDIVDAFWKRMSERQLRLFSVACCRRAWFLIGEQGRKAVEVAELYADGCRCKSTLLRAWRAAESEATDLGKGARWSATTAAARAAAPDRPWEPAQLNAKAAATAASWAVVCQQRGWRKVRSAEWKAQADLLRDIVNPWLPSISCVVLAWNGGTVVRLAQGIYDDRAFDRLPVLADALEEAGCHNADILGHCRHPGPHVRGCWAVDMLLGKG